MISSVVIVDLHWRLIVEDNIEDNMIVLMTVELKETGDIEKVIEMLKAVGFDPQIKQIKSLKRGSQLQEPAG